jgi:hypothetical protein
MPRHSPDQRKTISDLIRDYHLAFRATILGPKSIDDEDLKRLKAQGLIKRGAVKPVDAATAAVVVGALSGAGAKPKSTPTGSTFYSVVQAKVGVSGAEKEAIEIARDSIGVHITGLGNRVDLKTRRLLIDSDAKARARKRDAIREIIAEGISERHDTREIAQRLREVLADARRDWLQIATTEVHTAMEEGKAAELETRYPGDPLVYKITRPDACPFCKLLYLVDGIVPRVFHLSEMRSNGTNEGRRRGRPQLTGPHATEWKAVVGAMHPWCACTLHLLPDGYAFDSGGNLVPGTPVIGTLNKALLNHECR